MGNRALLLAGGVILAATLPAAAADTSLVAHLLGATAHTKSDAFAEAQFSYDPESKKLDYYVNYDGVAPIKVDIHGSANGNENGPSLLSLPPSESPISGTATLSAGEADMLLAGRTYIDIHSQAFPEGEISGRIARQ
jgi:hypothetical protein